jgi:putative ABC transport system permease protein
MEIEDQILNLATKKLANKATAEELQELNDLLSRNPNAQIILEIMFSEWESNGQASKVDTDRLFEKIVESIKKAETNPEKRKK